jgi:hypothetical protein
MSIDAPLNTTTTTAAKRAARRSGVAALAVVAGCALACSLPLLIGVGAVTSLGALLGGWRIVGAVLITAAAAAAVVWWFVRRTRRAARRAEGESGAGCGDANCAC